MQLGRGDWKGKASSKIKVDLLLSDYFLQNLKIFLRYENMVHPGVGYWLFLYKNIGDKISKNALCL